MTTVETDVKERYAAGAQAVEPELCCPVDYDASLLEILPQEIIDKDYGCGDPSRYVQEGDVVLDLGSGGGKICYMAAQLTGPKGRVIGVDMTDDMLALARKYQGEMAEKLGGDRVAFKKGYIQDLALDLEALERFQAENPGKDPADWIANQKKNAPLIADDSVDLVVSNCVLNLVDDAQKAQLIEGIFRVLKPGGRIAISDIVCDENPPESMKKDPELWSGCISGAYQERAFVEAFQQAGFIGAVLDKWDDAPWQTVESIEFRSVTVTATKPPAGENRDLGHAAIYRGPFAEVADEVGNRFPAGARIAVSEETFARLGAAPFKDQFVLLSPGEALSGETFAHPPGTLRPPAVTRQGESASGGACCPPSSSSSGCC